MNNTVLLSIIVILSITIAIYFVVEFKIKKWSCVEGKCERVLGGDYTSANECEQKCANSKAKNKKVTFSPNAKYY